MTGPGADVGEQLVARGWRQGVLLPAIMDILSHELVPGTAPSYQVRRRDSGDGALVVATQTCDLKKKASKEPEVECLRAFWTGNERIIRSAATNSVQHFLLREHMAGGERKGLIADASARVLVAKESLLHLIPEQGCADSDTERRFRRWLGRRYDRPAIPTSLVEAVQRPIVEALRANEGERAILQLLNGVREVLFAVGNDARPYRVHLLFMAEEGLTTSEPLTEADSERLAAWFGEALAAAGQAELHEWEMVDTGAVSLRDYLAFTPLPLDEYSL